jgi:hypothetical protein
MTYVGNAGIPATEVGWDYLHVSGAGTFVVATGGPVVLHAININSSGTLCSVYDTNTSNVSGIPLVAAIQTTSAHATNIYDVRMFNGIVIVTTGASTDLTITFGPVLP